MNIIITGGSGYLGRALTESLLTNKLLSKLPKKHADKLKNKTPQTTRVFWVSRNKNILHPNGVEILTYDEFVKSDIVYDVLINLAGAGIADARWSDKRKKELYDSRLQPTQAVLDYLHQIQTANVTHDGINNDADVAYKPKLFISSSAIGWYGAQDKGDNAALTEMSEFVKNDFSHQLCTKWESLAFEAHNNIIKVGNQADTAPIKLAIIRTGVVLDIEGGMIGRLKLPFSLGVGGQLGDGAQLMSWISRRDWVRAVEFIIEKNLQQEPSLNASQATLHSYEALPAQQIYNLTTPTAITNKDFTKVVGSWLKRPTVFKQPESVLKTIFGEMSTLLIDGQNIKPQQLLDMTFEFTELSVSDVLKNKKKPD